MTKESRKEFTLPLRPTLVTTVILSTCITILLTVGVMGIPAYSKAKVAFLDLWKNLSRQVSQTVTEQILSFFQSAPETLRFIEGLVESKVVTLDKKENIFDVCYRALRENPPFQSVYYALKNGTFFGVFRDGDQFIGHYRQIIGPDKTELELYRISPNGEWVSTGELINDYDPRLRPFWKKGETDPAGGWTEPYRFATTKFVGYSYVLGQIGTGGIEGFWGIDFDIDQLSKFLEGLQIGANGAATVMTQEGVVIAQSKKNWTSKEIEVGKKAFEGFREKKKSDGYEEEERWIFYIDDFPEESQIPWTLMTMIHESDYLGPIRSSSLHSFYWGLLPCALFVVFSGMLFGKIANRMKLIAHQIDQVGHLSFDIGECRGSRIREVNTVERAITGMRAGLKSFSKYVPTELVKKLMESGSSAKLGGDKRKITVIFADLAQFSSISEKKETMQVVRILEKFLVAATKEVHKEKGTIDKFVGDSIMAIWGAPDLMDDHATRACRMALGLKEAAKNDPEMRFKCGINTGEAMVGNFGSDERMDYTAIGDSVNIAVRLEKLNKVYQTQILLGPETASAVSEKMYVRKLDRVQIAGREGSFDIYELFKEKKEPEPDLESGIAAYESGLMLFRQRQFSEAIDYFERADTLLKGDIPSQLFIKGAKKYQVSPPSENWRGQREML